MIHSLKSMKNDKHTAPGFQPIFKTSNVDHELNPAFETVQHPITCPMNAEPYFR